MLSLERQCTQRKWC